MDKIVNMEGKAPEFEDFKIGDLFEVKNGERIIKSKQKPGNIPYVTASTINNGIDSYISNPLFTDRDILTVNFFGNVYYHPYKVAWKDGTYGLKLKDKNLLRNKNIYLYFLTIIQKTTKNLGSYSKMLTGSILQNTVISLPVISPGVPDWDYMENYIKEVEQGFVDRLLEENIEEISQLKKLVDFENIEELNKTPQFEDFRIGELFEIKPTNNYKNLKDEEIISGDGKIPFITTTVSYNGIKGFSNLEPNNQGNVITASDTTTTDAIFYQKEAFIGRSHVQGLIPKYIFNREIAMYIITCMKKSAGDNYSYGFKFNRNEMRNTIISLPVISSGVPDWNYMENYIRIIEKNYIIMKENYHNNNIKLLKEIIKK